MTTHSVQVPSGIRHAVAAESTRYAINGLEVRSDGNGSAYLSATDGRVLAVRRVEGDVNGAEPFIVPASMLPRRKSGETITYTDGKLTGLKSRITDEPIAATFPPCASVVPDVAECSKDGKPKYDRVITISAKLLYNLALAITDGRGNDSLRVAICLPTNPAKPFAVLPAGDDTTDSLAVLMPCSGVERQPFVESYSARRDAYCSAVKS